MEILIYAVGCLVFYAAWSASQPSKEQKDAKQKKQHD